MTRSTLTRHAFLLRHFADQLTSIRYCVQEARLAVAFRTPPFKPPSLGFQRLTIALLCADLQLRHALRRAFAGFKPPLPNQPSESAPLPTLTRPPFVRVQYLTCGNYDFNYGIDDGPRSLPPPSLSALDAYARPDRAQTAARICGRSATSGRR